MQLQPSIFNPSRFFATRGHDPSDAIASFVNAVNKFSSSHAKKVAANMAAAFNRTKRSYELQNTTYRNTGSIDIGRIHSYKTSDDIFKRTAMMPNGKNHGVMLVLDWSGSINSSATKIAMQYLITVYFLKQVKIPFSVSIFTSGGNSNEHDRTEDSVSLLDLRQIEIANDSYSNSELQDTFNDLICAQYDRCLYDSPYANYIHKHFYFGGTPLIESHVATYTNAMKLKRERKIDNMTIMYITDGDGKSLRNGTHRVVSGITDPLTGRTYMCKNDTAQLSPVNRMIRDAGIKIFNVYIDASLSTPATFYRRNDDRIPSKLSWNKISELSNDFSSGLSWSSGCCEVKGLAFYNSVIFTTASCFSNIRVDTEDSDEDELNVESSVASLKKSITSSSKWLKGASMVGDLIVKQIVNEYSKK